MMCLRCFVSLDKEKESFFSQLLRYRKIDAELMHEDTSWFVARACRALLCVSLSVSLLCKTMEKISHLFFILPGHYEMCSWIIHTLASYGSVEEGLSIIVVVKKYMKLLLQKVILVLSPVLTNSEENDLETLQTTAIALHSKPIMTRFLYSCCNDHRLLTKCMITEVKARNTPNYFFDVLDVHYSSCTMKRHSLFFFIKKLHHLKRCFSIEGSDCVQTGPGNSFPGSRPLHFSSDVGWKQVNQGKEWKPTVA